MLFFISLTKTPNDLELLRYWALKACADGRTLNLKIVSSRLEFVIPAKAGIHFFATNMSVLARIST
jgi:hypothetical protein